jgi:hypothetical protein
MIPLRFVDLVGEPRYVLVGILQALRSWRLQLCSFYASI